MVTKYKMANCADNLMLKIKDELKNELLENVEELNRLKEIMLKNEVIILEDF